MKYIILTTEDYADEFDYPILSIFEEHIYVWLKDNKDLIYETFTTSEEFYFGTNEAIYFNGDEINHLISEAKIISDEEIKTLAKFGLPNRARLDIVQRVLEQIHDDY